MPLPLITIPPSLTRNRTTISLSGGANSRKDPQISQHAPTTPHLHPRAQKSISIHPPASASPANPQVPSTSSPSPRQCYPTGIVTDTCPVRAPLIVPAINAAAPDSRLINWVAKLQPVTNPLGSPRLYYCNIFPSSQVQIQLRPLPLQDHSKYTHHPHD